MSQLHLTLPDTLQQELAVLAQGEGMPLQQYILYALTRQVSLAYRAWKLPESATQSQQRDFSELLAALGEASPDTLQSVLQAREKVVPEAELADNTVQCLQQRIQRYKTQ
jgi:hypothetical protein